MLGTPQIARVVRSPRAGSSSREMLTTRKNRRFDIGIGRRKRGFRFGFDMAPRGFTYRTGRDRPRNFTRCRIFDVVRIMQLRPGMSIEDRVHASVEEAVRSLVQQVLTDVIEDRDAAVTAAREEAYAEAENAAEARFADVEARYRAQLNDALAEARADERERAAQDVQSQVDAAAQSQIVEAIASVENRLGKVLAEAQAQAAEEMSRAVAATRARDRQAEMAGVNRLLESIRGLDGAATQAEVLDALALAAGRETSRAAVLVPRGERLQGWKLSGFGSRDSHPKAVDLNLNDAGLLGLALSTTRSATTHDAPSPLAGPGFEPLAADRMGFAVPVVATGKVVAIVYADGASVESSDQDTPAGWPEVIEV